MEKKELQKAIDLAIYDLQEAQEEFNSDNIDAIENALCRIDTLIFNLYHARKDYIKNMGVE